MFVSDGHSPTTGSVVCKDSDSNVGAMPKVEYSVQKTRLRLVGLRGLWWYCFSPLWGDTLFNKQLTIGGFYFLFNPLDGTWKFCFRYFWKSYIISDASHPVLSTHYRISWFFMLVLILTSIALGMLSIDMGVCLQIL